MILSSRIKNYYYQNINSLPIDKQFHFATRMAAWNGDSVAFEMLRSLRNTIVEADNLTDVFGRIVSTPQTGRRNAHELRQPFFEKYPSLYGTHAALFRLRHLESVYGVDARQQFFEVCDKKDLDLLYDTLSNDPEALRILSTFAINFMYLYQKIALRNSDAVDATLFLRAAEGYDLSDKLNLQLKIYLYTHCIIGDSNFYTEQVPAQNLEAYKTMLAELEGLISDNFEFINLDNKLEFLVACRIVGFDSGLFERIDAECQQSISPEGDFVIDTHNENLQEDKVSFEKSEHRNVLYIMSASEYAPHSTIV